MQRFLTGHWSRVLLKDSDMVDPAIKHPLAPKRRWFLKTTLAIGALGAAFGGLTYWKRGISNAVLTEQGRDIFKAVTRAVLSNVLPADKALREAKIDHNLARLDEIIQSMPTSSQIELAGLLGLLANAPTRWMLTGLGKPWTDASVQEINAALDAMRVHSQITSLLPYHVLRDLTCLAFFSTPDNWSLAAYPGPLDI